MRSLATYLGLNLKLSTAYHPQTDGESESVHSTLLRCFANKYYHDWSLRAPAVLCAYHNTVHTATGYTPLLLLFLGPLKIYVRR
jgi:hypothetical protein